MAGSFIGLKKEYVPVPDPCPDACAGSRRNWLTIALTFVALVALVLPVRVAGQDAFGTSVAITGPDEVVILKPGAQRGPSQALVFRRNAAGWERSGSLLMLDGGMPGEVLTPTLTTDAAGQTILLGAGDPRGAVAGHLYERIEGAWRGIGRLPSDPAGPPETGIGPAGLDMGTLMALMEPSARRAVMAPSGTTLALVGGSVPGDAVRIMRRDATGWRVAAELTLSTGLEGGEDGSAELQAEGLSGNVLAYDGDIVVAGAPERESRGAAALWAKASGTGTWRFEGWLRGAERDGRFGSAVALAGDEVMIGAPGADAVVRHVRDGDGQWQTAGTMSLDSVVEAEAQVRSAGFGAALAATDDHLAVGAPEWDEGRGAVVVYRRSAGGDWGTGTLLAPPELRPGDRFGSALHIGHGHLAVGAPGAYGGRGRAALYGLEELGDGPSWLDAGEPLAAVGGETVPCSRGAAEGFACDRVDLMAFVPLSALGASPAERVTDLWGWTDPETGREYVLLGRTAGLAVIDVTHSGAPVLVGFMPANPSSARDIKVHEDHAFMTGDGAGDHGLLVFDLAHLREVQPEAMPVTFEPDARYDEVASAHNLVIDTDSGFAYTVGTNTGGRSCGGGLHMIDIREPLSPTFAGCFTDSEGLIWSGRTHDAQCTVYRGPDTAYQGRQICFAANETAMRVVDVTDKANPVVLSGMSHPGTAYVHQGWLTEDQRYLYVNDELDEIVGTSERTRTLIWDVAELDDPVLVAEHLGPDRATDHNLYISGERAYLANYQAGFRLLDISDPEAPVEIGWFDTTPYGENPPGFNGGAWTAFPFFESGTVAVSSMNEGLFLLKPRPIVP